jgi:perosamine synthetase
VLPSMPSEPGAIPPADFIPLCVPSIQGNEWNYVKECLDTNWVSSVGPFVDRFERDLAARVGARHAVATVNGTAALHIALLAVGVRPDDEVLVSTLSFIAPANAIRYTGAWPVFIDVEPDYWQMDPQKVMTFLDRECRWSNGRLHNRTTGRQIRAILPVHILGHPCDMDMITEVAARYDLPIVEDATESLGALYRGRPVGRLGIAACFSFNGNKLITTGGGGMVVTDDEAIARRARYLTTQAKDDPVEFVHGEIGYNYRLTNIQAAMGCAQLERLNECILAKRKIATRYAETLKDVPGILAMPQAPWAESVFWMYTVLVDSGSYGMDSRALLRALEAAKIQTRPLWQPIHRSRPHAGCCVVGGEVAEALNRSALSLPCSVSLTEDEQDRVIVVVRGLWGGAVSR